MKMVGRFGLAALVLVFLGGLGLWAMRSYSPITTTSAPLEAKAPVTTPAPPEAIEVKDFSIGAEDAKVTIIEYASFTCPHCANFHATVYGPLKADYIDTGKVRFEIREVYFDRFGLWAAMMARCGGEMRYFGITDILFETQKEWAGTDDPAVAVENLKKIGRTAGMEDAALDVCMKDQVMAEALLNHFQTNFTADGVEGTPTFFINGTRYSNMDYEELKTILDAELAK